MSDQAPDAPGTLSVVPLVGIGEIRRGDDLGVALSDSLARAGLRLVDGDVLVVSSKVVSKSLGLREPSSDKEAVVRRQSRRVVAERTGATGVTRVVHAQAGPVMAAAGVDASNTGPDAGILTLPPDPDLAARSVYAALLAACSPAPLPLIGIVLSDTAGRPWRVGQSDFALGACGLNVLDDLRGGIDSDGRDLAVTTRAVADQIAAAADLVKGKVAGIPAALVRGLPAGTTAPPGVAGAARLVRAGPEDWFGHGQAEAVRSALGAEPGTIEADQVGIPAVAMEAVPERLARAIRLARLGEDADDLQVDELVDDTGRITLRVRGDDRFRLGRLAARLEVALHSELLAGPLTHDVPPVRVLT